MTTSATAPNTPPLREQRCTPVAAGEGLDTAQIQDLLVQLPQWRLVDRALERRFGFPDFHRTMAFVNGIAWIAHREDHHPDLAVGYDYCTVRLHTHAVGGLSRNDFVCAARIDALRGDSA
ncbi:MAG: 4a-hydroxytetrahydrobiopterin dehydratase [Rubrivivax sp.]